MNNRYQKGILKANRETFEKDVEQCRAEMEVGARAAGYDTLERIMKKDRTTRIVTARRILMSYFFQLYHQKVMAEVLKMHRSTVLYHVQKLNDLMDVYPATKQKFKAFKQVMDTLREK